jgi:hypothetical protein
MKTSKTEKLAILATVIVSLAMICIAVIQYMAVRPMLD